MSDSITDMTRPHVVSSLNNSCPECPHTDPTYDPREQEVLMAVFTEMLRAVTRDGGSKRVRGEKPNWWQDGSHERAIFSHLYNWKRGETADKDSGAHPLVHLAWRALAIAYIEMHGKVNPAGPDGHYIGLDRGVTNG